MILCLIYGFCMVTCTVSPLSRFTAHLLPVYLIVRIFHLCRARCFRLACDPFSGNECWDIYKFDTNERVGVFLARRSVQHLVLWSETNIYEFWQWLSICSSIWYNKKKLKKLLSSSLLILYIHFLHFNNYTMIYLKHC